MAKRRIHAKIDRTPDEIEELKKIREKYQKEKPGKNDLIQSGDVIEFVTMGEFVDLQQLVFSLKCRRKRLGFTITKVSEDSSIDKGAISRLEHGQHENPTVATLNRYAKALGTRLSWCVRGVDGARACFESAPKNIQELAEFVRKQGQVMGVGQ